jgi:hypothetical protein
VSVLDTKVYQVKGEAVLGKCITLVEQKRDRRCKPYLYEIQVEALSAKGPFFAFYYSEAYYIGRFMPETQEVAVEEYLSSIYYNFADDLKCLSKLWRYFGVNVPAFFSEQGEED